MGKRGKRGGKRGKRKASSIESKEGSDNDMETNKTTDSSTDTAVDEQSTTNPQASIDQQGAQQQKQHTSGFLPEPFPKASTLSSSTQHLHDAYGDDLNDEGVDYGPPNEFEEEDDDDEVGKSEGLEQQNDNSVDVMDMNAVKEVETAIKQQDDSADDIKPSSQQNQQQEQLEETLELHTTTLQTLHSKLQSLSTSISTENVYNSELTTDIKLLQKRKLIFKKKTDKNIKLVKELETSLDKCLSRLRYALDELNDDDGEDIEGLDGEVGLDEELGLGGEEKVLEAAARLNEVADGSLLSPLDISEEVKSEGAQQPLPLTATSQQQDANSYNIKVIPLKSNPHRQTPNISWPSTKLVTKRYNEIKSLSTNIGIPTTHLTILSLSGGSSILGGLNNVQLIVNVMNVAALENLIQREEHEGGNNEMTRRNEQSNSSSCGWVKESDVWGTSLDVYTHVNWKTLLAGFTRRIEEDDEQQQQTGGLTSSSAKRDRNECSVVDPNTILCPYELGGECADGQCPYQHLKQRGDINDQGHSNNGVREGYVRYNNLPKTKLPRSFVKEDFVISGAEVQDDDTDAADMSNNDKKEQRIEDDRHFHCPICVVHNEQSSSSPYNSQEELLAHMAECHKQSSSQTAKGKSVTIRHTLLTAEDAAIRNQEILKHYAAKNEQHDSSSDDDSTSAEGDEHMEHQLTEGNDTSMTSHLNDNGSAPTEEEEDADQLHAGVEDNLDYVSLPSVADSFESTSNQGGRIGSGLKKAKKRTIFNNTFWWQQIGSFLIPEDAIKECQDTFHSLLLSFGFQYLTNDEGTGHSLGCIMPTPSDEPTPAQEQANDVLLFSRLIDLSRVLVHMGRLSFALVVMSSIEIRIEKHPLICRPYWRAYQTVKSLIQSQHSAYTLFQVQVQLLVLSEYLRTNYDSLVGNDAPCLNQLLVDQILNLHDVGKYSENNLFPEGFDRLRQSLVSQLPSARHDDKSNDGDDWVSFTKTLKHIIEKFIIVPFSQIGTDDQFLFLLRSVCIGKYLGNNIVHNASKERGFVSYLHALEPIWTSIQPLLQVSLTSTCTRWLQPDVVAIVLIGPIIFSCVADMIASSDSGKKTSPKFDARALANLSTLDNFIVGIIKDLNRFGRSRGSSQLVEPLLAPLYALSTTISVALGSFDKANVRLEHVLNKEVEERPSLYALSDLMWSQLVQLRSLCPSYSTPLDTSDVVPKSLPDQITKVHHKLASRIAESGIFLWGVKLRGDSHMNIISPCFNKNHCTEWEKAVTQIFTYHKESDSEQASQPSLEFSISDPYPEELEGIRTSRESVFPDSLLLLGKSLTSLTLDKCGLTRLPLSIGYYLTNLKVSCFVPYHSRSNLFVLLALPLSQRHAGNTQNKSLNLVNNLLSKLPDSICCMVQLEVVNLSYNKLKIFPQQLSQCSKLRVIDVSYNQLDTFPADLALQCNNLESFIVDGNPAAVSSPPSAKRQKVGKDWSELF